MGKRKASKSSRVILITLIVTVLWAILSIIFSALDLRKGNFEIAVIICKFFGDFLAAAIIIECFIGIRIADLSAIQRKISYILLSALSFVAFVFITLETISDVTGMFIMTGKITWDAIAFTLCGVICILISALLFSTGLVARSFRFLKSHTSLLGAIVLFIMGCMFFYLTSQNKIDRLYTVTSPDNSVTYKLAFYPETTECAIYRYENKYFSELIFQYTMQNPDMDYFNGDCIEARWNEENKRLVIVYYNTNLKTEQSFSVKYA